MIYVRTTDPTRIALWERNTAHPEGEIMISGPTDQVHAVAETAGVQAAIRRGALVEVEAPAPASEQPEGDAETPTARRSRKPKAGADEPADPAAGVA